MACFCRTKATQHHKTQAILTLFPTTERRGEKNCLFPVFFNFKAMMKAQSVITAMVVFLHREKVETYHPQLFTKQALLP